MKYLIYIHPPSKYKNDTNVTLYLNIGNNVLHQFDSFSSSFAQPETELSRVVSPPDSPKYYALKRKISEDEINELQMDLMPGFRLEWHYNKELQHVFNPSDIKYYFTW